MIRYCMLMLLLMPLKSLAGKQQCQPYLEKLRNIQSMQRLGHSNKQAHSLANREQKARDKWWQCQQGKLKPKKAARSTSAKNKTKAKVAKIKAPTINSDAPLPTLTSSLVIRGEFSGQQQQDWLDYYRPQDKCKKPRTTQVFAFCMADRRKQRDEFVKQYGK